MGLSCGMSPAVPASVDSESLSFLSVRRDCELG